MSTIFQEKVYKICKKIPKGKVTTYLQIARKLKNNPRSIGNALNKNPYSFMKKGKVPCHRVIKSNGVVGGFAYGTNSKIKLLKKEGIKIKDNKVELEKFGFNFRK